jgi:hypothetical protein
VKFDKAYYDFQAVGEFVVVHLTAGDSLEVQARQAQGYPENADPAAGRDGAHGPGRRQGNRG